MSEIYKNLLDNNLIKSQINYNKYIYFICTYPFNCLKYYLYNQILEE
jgi:hypothetical protein